jgi:hypothetical protein
LRTVNDCCNAAPQAAVQKQKKSLADCLREGSY